MGDNPSLLIPSSECELSRDKLADVSDQTSFRTFPHSLQVLGGSSAQVIVCWNYLVLRTTPSSFFVQAGSLVTTHPFRPSATSRRKTCRAKDWLLRTDPGGRTL